MAGHSRQRLLQAVHEVERVAALAGPLGVVRPDGRLPFALKVPHGQAEALVATLAGRGVDAGRSRLLVAPGSRWATKRWLPERFAQAARTLADRLAADVAVVGAKEEAAVGALVRKQAGPVAVDLTGALPIGQLLALVSRAPLVLSNDSAAAVRRMLEEVVRPGGTGTKAAVTGYRVAGKTGTAWKFAAGGYSEDKYISIFAGLAPASDPRLAAVVVIDEPSGELYYGSDVAAPVFADVMSESLRLLAVPPDAMPARDPGSIMQAMSR